MRPVILSRTLAAAAVGAVAAAQTTGGAANLLINGSLASGGVATLAAQQQLGFTSAGNIAAVIFTITGTDDQNRVISETVTGVNANTVNTVLNYKTVTQIATSTAVGSAVSVDTRQVGASSAVPIDTYLNPTDISVSVIVTGTVNYTVQWTQDDVFAGTGVGPFTWFSAAANLVGATTTQAGSIGAPVSAIRVLTNSGGGTAQLIIRQSGAVA